MKNITATMTLLVFVAALALGACGKSEMVKKAADIEKKACACDNMDCLQEVQKMIKSYQGDAAEKKVTKSDKEKIEEHMKKATKCIMEIPSKMKKKAKGGDEPRPRAE